MKTCLDFKIGTLCYSIYFNDINSYAKKYFLDDYIKLNNKECLHKK